LTAVASLDTVPVSVDPCGEIASSDALVDFPFQRRDNAFYEE